MALVSYLLGKLSPHTKKGYTNYMELKFIVSERSLFISNLLQNIDLAGWVDLQNKLWDKYKTGYQLLQGNFDRLYITEFSENTLERGINEIKLLMEEGMKTAVFDKLLQSTHKYKKWLEKEWLVNKAKVENELKDIMRTEFTKEVFTVYVMGNLVHEGRHLGDRKIVWGHKEDWPNYSLVYLAHEYLHSMFSRSDLDHAIIELITDNELRIRLNHSGEYFSCGGKETGHGYLSEIEKKLYPSWQIYLKNKKQTIFEFVQEQKL